MSHIPREARDGLMRTWLAILGERHPEYTWIAIDQTSSERESQTEVADSRDSDAGAAGDIIAAAA